MNFYLLKCIYSTLFSEQFLLFWRVKALRLFMDLTVEIWHVSSKNTHLDKCETMDFPTCKLDKKHFSVYSLNACCISTQELIWTVTMCFFNSFYPSTDIWVLAGFLVSKLVAPSGSFSFSWNPRLVHLLPGWSQRCYTCIVSNFKGVWPILIKCSPTHTPSSGKCWLHSWSDWEVVVCMARVEWVKEKTKIINVIIYWGIWI